MTYRCAWGWWLTGVRAFGLDVSGTTRATGKVKVLGDDRRDISGHRLEFLYESYLGVLGGCRGPHQSKGCARGGVEGRG